MNNTEQIFMHLSQKKEKHAYYLTQTYTSCFNPNAKMGKYL